jgi:hypothetical protein
MTDPSRDQPSEAPLNPALKSRTETVYDTKTSTPAPYDTASAKPGEGEGWPLIWLAATLLGIALALYLIL